MTLTDVKLKVKFKVKVISTEIENIHQIVAKCFLKLGKKWVCSLLFNYECYVLTQSHSNKKV